MTHTAYWPGCLRSTSGVTSGLAKRLEAAEILTFWNAWGVSRSLRQFLGRQFPLTKRGDAYIFQIRRPRTLDPQTASSPIRINLGRLPRRAAQRAAGFLGAAATIAFEPAREGNMVNSDGPLLGFVTGRRLGLLSFICGEGIRCYHNCRVTSPRSIMRRDDR